jgi:nucleoside-diphosphate-sugar epimerase
MTTLIVGAGLVGAQVARILVEKGERPILFDNAPQTSALSEVFDLSQAIIEVGDILRPLTLAATLRRYEVTRIAHTAANPMLTLGAQQDPYAAINLNIMGAVNVIEVARAFGIKRVVISSSNVLNHFVSGGDASNDPMREAAFPRPTTFYASTKQAIENLGLNYARWYGIEFGAMRYGAVFGPWNGAGGGGPSNLMREAMWCALAGQEAVLPSGNMEWVYSKDAGRGTVLALEAKDLGPGVFNITMGVLSTPEATARALGEIVPGCKVRIETPSTAAVALPNMNGVSDLSTSANQIGYRPAYGLVGALQDLAVWMKAHPRP